MDIETLNKGADILARITRFEKLINMIENGGAKIIDVSTVDSLTRPEEMIKKWNTEYLDWLHLQLREHQAALAAL